MTPVYFRHFPEERRTFAVLPVPRCTILAALTNMKRGKNAEFKFQMGVAYVHPNDRYCKATGRYFAGVDVQWTIGNLERAIIETHGTLYRVRIGNDAIHFYRRHGHKFAKLDSIYPDYYE